MNFRQSELFLFGDANDGAELYQEILTCQLRNLPMNILACLSLILESEINIGKVWRIKLKKDVDDGKVNYWVLLLAVSL